MNLKKVLAAIFFAVIILTAVVIIYFAEYASYDLDRIQIDKKDYFEKKIAHNMGYGLNKTRDILQTTSNIPEVYNVPNAAQIDPKLHGIPKEMDYGKRSIALQVLTEDSSLETVFFLMPNGDEYIVEPYYQQLHLKSSNFSFRDYYKGVVETQKPYLSGAFKSQATGHNVAVITIPIYSGNHTLTGIWGGAMDLAEVQSNLNTVNIGKDGMISIVDSQGYLIAHSGSSKIADIKLDQLESYKKALSGQSGSMTEEINGTNMQIFYTPVKTFSGTWVMFDIEPYDTLYMLSQTMKSLEIITLPLLTISAIVFVVTYKRQG